jgi:hypothetical protein
MAVPGAATTVLADNRPVTRAVVNFMMTYGVFLEKEFSAKDLCRARVACEDATMEWLMEGEG